MSEPRASRSAERAGIRALDCGHEPTGDSNVIRRAGERRDGDRRRGAQIDPQSLAPRVDAGPLGEQPQAV